MDLPYTSRASERQVKTIKGALQIFSTGVLVMDEVDLLLHPTPTPIYPHP